MQGAAKDPFPPRESRYPSSNTLYVHDISGHFRTCEEVDSNLTFV